jgi:cephalosporin-C deacetylase
MSQGGGISIWLGAWCPIIKCVCADMPFLGGMRAVFERGVYRYPLKELPDYWETIPIGQERVFNTISYYDTMHQATRCKKPTQVTLGEKDPSVRPANAVAIYDALPGEKKLIRYEIGHDWIEDMIPNNVDWMTRHLG